MCIYFRIKTGATVTGQVDAQQKDTILHWIIEYMWLIFHLFDHDILPKFQLVFWNPINLNVGETGDGWVHELVDTC